MRPSAMGLATEDGKGPHAGGRGKARDASGGSLSPAENRLPGFLEKMEPPTVFPGLFGAVLSIVDVITDIAVTLVWWRSGHIMWAAVSIGLLFFSFIWPVVVVRPMFGRYMSSTEIFVLLVRHARRETSARSRR